MDDFTLTLPDLDGAAAWLARVVPHIGGDETIPFLSRVQISIGAGHLLAVATDRYTLAVSRLEAPTGDVRGVFTVPGSLVRAVADAYADEGVYDAATLTVSGAAVTLAVPYDEPVTAPLGEDCDDWWAGWRGMVRASLDHPAAATPARVRADLLGRFAPGGPILHLGPDRTVSLADAMHLPYTVHLPADVRSPVVLLSRDLLGLIAPYRVRDPQTTPAPAEEIDARALWAPILTDREQVAA